MSDLLLENWKEINPSVTDLMVFLIKKNQSRIDQLPPQKRLYEYFGFWMKYGQRYCENCMLKGKETIITPFDIFAAQAHILPKRSNQFPSVATQLWNHMTLGATCGCHDRYDRSWDDAIKMPVMLVARDRYELFKENIREKHLVPEIFNQPIITS